MQCSVAELHTPDQLAAILHPLRRRVLAELAEAASPSEVARRVGIPAQLANYHIRALEAAGLATEVETVQRRNLLEHRYRSVARSFTFSTHLPLSDEQRHRLQSDTTLQQLVHTGDAIRQDALQLLDASIPGCPLAAAALEIEVELADTTDRQAFVRAVTEAVRQAASPFRHARGAATIHYRTHLAIYPLPDDARQTPPPPKENPA
jgi:DNA-binding transcriptional ArsR family regulator